MWNRIHVTSGLKPSVPETQTGLGKRGQVETETGLPEGRDVEMALQTHSSLRARSSAYF